MTDNIESHVLLSRLTGAFLPLNREDPAPYLAEIVRICETRSASILDDAATILIDTWRSTPAQPWPSVARIRDAISEAAFRAQASNGNPKPAWDPGSETARRQAARLIRADAPLWSKACQDHWIVPLFEFAGQHGRLPSPDEQKPLIARAEKMRRAASIPGDLGMVARAYLARCKSTIETIHDYADQEAA